MTISEANGLSCEEFTRVFGGVFEHSPWIAEEASALRPFRGLDHLHASLCNTVSSVRAEKQLELISSHPDLVGRAAIAGTLTVSSIAEQSSAGLNSLSLQEIELFQKYNGEYRMKFGFPFVICARLNKKEAILRAFPLRLQNSRDCEIQTALEEIYKIAYLRLKDIITEA